MTNRNGAYGSKNQNSPKRHGQITGSIGDNNKGTEYRSRKGSKSAQKHPNNE